MDTEDVVSDDSELPVNSQKTSLQTDKFRFAKSLFDNREYARAAKVLERT